MTNTPDKPPRSLLALDFGLRRIGIATGSCVTGTASALVTIDAHEGEPDWDRLDELVKEWQPELLVLGLPLSPQGEVTDLANIVTDFADLLKSRYELPVELVDERYTSVEAESLLKEQRRSGVRNKRLKKTDIDSLAAQLIAESWMRSNENKP